MIDEYRAGTGVTTKLGATELRTSATAVVVSNPYDGRYPDGNGNTLSVKGEYLSYFHDGGIDEVDVLCILDLGPCNVAQVISEFESNPTFWANLGRLQPSDIDPMIQDDECRITSSAHPTVGRHIPTTHCWIEPNRAVSIRLMDNEEALAIMADLSAIAAPVVHSDPQEQLVSVSLPRGVSLSLPRSWVVLSDSARIALDTWAGSQVDLSRTTGSSDLSFAANLFAPDGQTIALVNVRYYPQMTATQNDVTVLTDSDVLYFDSLLRAEIGPGLAKAGMPLIEWRGTHRRAINGLRTFVTEYRRRAKDDATLWRARLVRVARGPRSFTVTLSYHENHEHLRSVIDIITGSIRVAE
jgi:hypothetical protein